MLTTVADTVKKKSFLKKVLLTKWFVITVLILGVSGYAAWWGWRMNWWTDFSAKIGGQPHETQVAQKIDAGHDTHSVAKDATHAAQTTHQPAAQKTEFHVTAQHTPEPQNHTPPHTTFNKTADEHKTVSHAPATSAAEHGTAHAAPVRTGPRGVAFVEACIHPP